MPLPTVRHCLICEDTRPELHGKLTITGFYGVAPYVGIVVKELEKPIDRLTFLLLCESEASQQERIRISFKLLHEDGASIFESPDSEVVHNFHPRAWFVLTVGNPLFAKQGKHFFAVRFDGTEVYKAEFSIQVGDPANFRSQAERAE